MKNPFEALDDLILKLHATVMEKTGKNKYACATLTDKLAGVFCTGASAYSVSYYYSAGSFWMTNLSLLGILGGLVYAGLASKINQANEEEERELKKRKRDKLPFFASSPLKMMRSLAVINSVGLSALGTALISMENNLEINNRLLGLIGVTYGLAGEFFTFSLYFKDQKYSFTEK